MSASRTVPKRKEKLRKIKEKKRDTGKTNEKKNTARVLRTFLRVTAECRTIGSCVTIYPTPAAAVDPPV